ncbi:MAG: hypothetical protein ABIN91_07885 [Mucilaginibacter sp.]
MLEDSFVVMVFEMKGLSSIKTITWLLLKPLSNTNEELALVLVPSES